MRGIWNAKNKFENFIEEHAKLNCFVDLEVAGPVKFFSRILQVSRYITLGSQRIQVSIYLDTINDTERQKEREINGEKEKGFVMTPQSHSDPNSFPQENIARRLE